MHTDASADTFVQNEVGSDDDLCYFYLKTRASFHYFSTLTTRLNAPTCRPPHKQSALSPLHYSEVIYNACGMMVPSYPSLLIIKQAFGRGLWLLPIPPPYHPPRTEHKTEGKGDCIYRKEEKERSKGTEGESYQFDWTTFLFSSSTEEISLKGCCSLSIAPQG